MKLSNFAKHMRYSSTCEIIIMQNGEQIKNPIAPKDFERKIDQEILENFTVATFEVSDNKLIFHVR